PGAAAGGLLPAGARPRRRRGRSSFLARPEWPADARLEANVSVEPDAVDLSPYAFDHLRRDVELVDLEDEVPRPRAPRDGTDLEHVVAERRDDARAERLPFGEERAEARQKDVAFLLLRRVEVRGQASAEHENAMPPGHGRTTQPRRSPPQTRPPPHTSAD